MIVSVLMVAHRAVKRSLNSSRCPTRRRWRRKKSNTLAPRKMRPRLFRRRWRGERVVGVLDSPLPPPGDPTDGARTARGRGKPARQGCLLPPAPRWPRTPGGEPRKRGAALPGDSPRRRLAIQPPHLLVRHLVSPRVNTGLQAAAAAAAVPYGVLSSIPRAVTKVTAARPAPVPEPDAPGSPRSRPTRGTRGRGSGERARPAQRALRAGPAHPRRRPMRTRTRGRPRWRYAAFGQSRAAQPSR